MRVLKRAVCEPKSPMLRGCTREGTDWRDGLSRLVRCGKAGRHTGPVVTAGSVHTAHRSALPSSPVERAVLFLMSAAIVVAACVGMVW